MNHKKGSDTFSKGFKRNIGFLLISFLTITIINAQNQYLEKSVSSISEETSEISNSSTHYKSIFSIEDDEVNAIERFAHVAIDPKGKTKSIDFKGLEYVYYVLEGTGTLQYDKEEVPISKDDFFYVPQDKKHAFENAREDTLNILMMAFRIPEDSEGGSKEVQIANTGKVQFQEMADHGATSRYKLLMGRTNSRRDRIAAASQMTSLFIIDFFPLGTNIPHTHPREEEIYFILDGKGKMVAGQDPEGHDLYHPAKPGDAFFVGKDTSVGFYSENGEGEEHAKVLAVRFFLPRKP